MQPPKIARQIVLWATLLTIFASVFVLQIMSTYGLEIALSRTVQPNVIFGMEVSDVFMAHFTIGTLGSYLALGFWALSFQTRTLSGSISNAARRAGRKLKL